MYPDEMSLSIEPRPVLLKFQRKRFCGLLSPADPEVLTTKRLAEDLVDLGTCTRIVSPLQQFYQYLTAMKKRLPFKIYILYLYPIQQKHFAIINF